MMSWGDSSEWEAEYARRAIKPLKALIENNVIDLIEELEGRELGFDDTEEGS
ncbi:MAG TPA: hypothetical protein VMT53_19920 [Terriglobales bacterium]|nr:hypothetical protein [Terriglobales bacterium]